MPLNEQKYHTHSTRHWYYPVIMLFFLFISVYGFYKGGTYEKIGGILFGCASISILYYLVHPIEYWSVINTEYIAWGQNKNILYKLNFDEIELISIINTEVERIIFEHDNRRIKEKNPIAHFGSLSELKKDLENLNLNVKYSS